MEALKNRAPQAKAITAKHEITFSWVFIGLLSYPISHQKPTQFATLSFVETS